MLFCTHNKTCCSTRFFPTFPHIFLGQVQVSYILTSFVSHNWFNLQNSKIFWYSGWCYYKFIIVRWLSFLRQIRQAERERAAGSLNWIGSTSIYRNGLALVSWLSSSFIRLTLKREHHVPSRLMNEQSIKKFKRIISRKTITCLGEEDKVFCCCLVFIL